MTFKHCHIIIVILCSSWIASTAQDNAMPISKWIQTIQQQSNFTFNYDQAILTKELIQVPPTLSDPKRIIAFIEENTKFSFKYIDDKTIVMTSRRSGSTFDAKKILLYIFDTNLKLPLSDVSLTVLERNLYLQSNADGIIKGSIYGQHSDIVTISCIGYESINFTLSNLPKSDTLWFTPSNQTLVELIITDQANEKFIKESTTLTLSKIPVLAGTVDKDPFSLVQTIPGIAGLGESVSNLSIRASTQDQNLIQWNDIPIYHTGHYIGLMSSINPYMVDAIDVYHDGFNSKFGNRVAGVIDMKSTQNHPDRLKVDLQSNLLTTNLHLCIPILKDKVSLDIAGRTSYGDKFQNITYNRFFDQSFQIGRITDIRKYIERNNASGEIFNTSQVSFKDLTAHLLITPSKRDIISLSYLTATDFVQNRLTFDWSPKIEVDSIMLTNQGYNVKWAHQFSKKLIWTNLYTYSGFSNAYSYHEDINKIVTLNSVVKLNKVSESKYHSALGWQHKNTFIDFGLEHRVIDNTNTRKFIPNDVYNIDSKEQKTASLSSLFLHYQYKASPTFVFDVGSRLTQYSLNDKYYFEPRMSMSQKLSNRLKLKITTGNYTQVLTQIEEYNNLQVEDLFWRVADGKTGNELVPFIKNTQSSVTLSYNHRNWEWSAGIFQKKLESITALGLEFDQSVNPYWIATGTGKGLETMIKKSWQRSSLFLSYIYNDLILDFGNERIFPAPYNSPHQINLIYSLNLGRFDFSLISKWKSGRPYSQYSQFRVDTNEFGDPDPKFEYERFFNLTLPSYLRIDFTGAYKILTHNKWNCRMGLSIINVTNSKNTLLRSHYVDYSEWPIISPATFDRRGLGFTPNVFVEVNF